MELKKQLKLFTDTYGSLDKYKGFINAGYTSYNQISIKLINPKEIIQVEGVRKDTIGSRTWYIFYIDDKKSHLRELENAIDYDLAFSMDENIQSMYYQLLQNDPNIMRILNDIVNYFVSLGIVNINNWEYILDMVFRQSNIEIYIARDESSL